MLAEWWSTFEGRCALSAGVSLLGFMLWRWWPCGMHRRRQVILLLAIASVARWLFLDLPASDDVHRYVWEGQLVLHGESPYGQRASDSEHRDEHWQRMNHKDKLTAYPPLALTLCAVIEAIQGKGLPAPLDHLLGFKIAAALADLLLISLLVSAVKELRWVALYAVNPVPLISFAGEGHFDIWMVLPMVASIVWIKRPRLAWSCLALAIGIKFIAVLLLPVLWHHTLRAERARAALWAMALLLLPALPFVATWPALIEGVYRFGAETSGNATLHWLLELALGNKSQAAGLSFGLMGVWIWYQRRRITQHAAASRELLTALLIAAPTVTYWYPGWALPFAVLAPHPALWVLSATNILYYAAWAEAEATGVWWLPRWAWAVLWGPFFVLWIRHISFREGSHPSMASTST
jgi:hypothetical protein